MWAKSAASEWPKTSTLLTKPIEAQETVCGWSLAHKDNHHRRLWGLSYWGQYNSHRLSTAPVKNKRLWTICPPTSEHECHDIITKIINAIIAMASSLMVGRPSQSSSHCLSSSIRWDKGCWEWSSPKWRSKLGAGDQRYLSDQDLTGTWYYLFSWRGIR